MDELEEKFNTAQAQLIDNFKTKLKSVADDVLGTMYRDVANYAATDAHTNYHNYLRDYFRESLIKEITEEYTHWSWAHSIRMKLMELYPEKIRNKIISDLEWRIKTLEEHLYQAQRSIY